MEKRDYLLLEIEKIGRMLNLIINRLAGEGPGSTADTEKILEETGKDFNEEFNFDLDAFLKMDKESSLGYLAKFDSFDTNNIELMARLIESIGSGQKRYKDNSYIEKALMLYEYCSIKDKVYSFERESRILAIKTLLENS